MLLIPTKTVVKVPYNSLTTAKQKMRVVKRVYMVSD
jgi:hypothetical protein